MIIFLLIGIILIILLFYKIKFNIDFSIINFEYYFAIRVTILGITKTFYLEDIKNNKKNKITKNKIKYIYEHINFERINLNINVGVGDVYITSFLIPIFSTILSIFLQKYMNNASKHFFIKPIYNKFKFSMKGSIYFSISIINIIKILFTLNKV